MKNKKTICNDEINSIENKKSKKYKLIKLITMCAIMMLFNVAFSNLAYALEISTEEEFRAFASSVKSNNTYEGQVVNINADINLNNTSLMPINNFAGTLDGHGHTISGLSVTTGEYRGLFGQIKASPTIKNLTLEGKIEANVSSYAAGFAAYVSGSPTFENCVNKVEVKGINTSVGGFIGAIQNTNTPNIINCYNEGNLTR